MSKEDTIGRSWIIQRTEIASWYHLWVCSIQLRFEWVMSKTKILAASKTVCNAGQTTAAVGTVHWPGIPALFALHLLGTSYGTIDVIRTQGIPVNLATVGGPSAIAGQAPVAIVDLEDTMIPGTIGVWWSHHPGTVAAFVLSNAHPTRKFVSGHIQIVHFSCALRPQSRTGIEFPTTLQLRPLVPCGQNRLNCYRLRR